MATPGLVTSNIVGGAPYQSVQDQASAYDLQQRMKRDKENEWARAAAANANLGKPARDPRAEADAQMKSAFEKFYAPMAQSQWNMQTGKTYGVDANRISGSAQPGYGAYQKRGMGIAAGQQPYQYRPDTPVPNYQQGLDQAYELWKAGQMMGAKDWEVKSTTGSGRGGGSKEAGATYSGNLGRDTYYESERYR